MGMTTDGPLLSGKILFKPDTSTLSADDTACIIIDPFLYIGSGIRCFSNYHIDRFRRRLRFGGCCDRWLLHWWWRRFTWRR
jgi:hypothetical protein